MATQKSQGELRKECGRELGRFLDAVRLGAPKAVGAARFQRLAEAVSLLDDPWTRQAFEAAADRAGQWRCCSARTVQKVAGLLP